MKKTFNLLATLLLCLFASCDLEETMEIKFVVSADQVISPFTEFHTGDFDLEDSQTVQIDIYIYDNMGKYVGEESSSLPDYNSTYTFSKRLKNGSYTVVAISRIVEPDGAYWTISNTGNLYDLKVTDNGYIGDDKKMLGLIAQSLNVVEDKVFSVDIKPISAMVMTSFINIHYFSNVTDLAIASSGFYSDINFNGSWKYTFKSKISPLSYIAISNYPDYDNIYAYNVILPSQYTFFGVMFYVEDGEDTAGATGNIDIDAKAGTQYLFSLELNEENTMTFSTATLTKSFSNTETVKTKTPKQLSYKVLDLLGKEFHALSPENMIH